MKVFCNKKLSNYYPQHAFYGSLRPILPLIRVIFDNTDKFVVLVTITPVLGGFEAEGLIRDLARVVASIDHKINYNDN